MDDLSKIVPQDFLKGVCCPFAADPALHSISCIYHEDTNASWRRIQASIDCPLDGQYNSESQAD